jgi:DNA-binding response OmpR family regulator
MTSPLILIVDDDPALRALLRLAMEEEGYRVAEAKEGEQGLVEYCRLQPDMVLMDAVMPGMDGFTCCRRLRSLPGGNLTPILTITVLDDPESVDRAFAAGATDYITKPIHWAVMSQRVRRLLAASQAQTRARQAEAALQRQIAWSHLFSEIARQLCQSFDLQTLLDLAVGEVRILLPAEEVLVWQAKDRLAEAVSAVSSSLLFPLQQPQLLQQYAIASAKLGVVAIEDISQVKLSENAFALFEQLHAQAVLTAPLWTLHQPSGIVCAYQYTSPYAWNAIDIERFADLANLLAIAIHQHTLQN